MKKLLLFALVATIAITGCKKDEDSKPSYPGEVTINNVKTSFTDMGFFKYGSTYQIENYGDNDQGNLEIYFDASSTGDVSFSEDSYIRIEVGSDKVYHSKLDGGKLTITQLDDKTVKGTFSGKFTDEDGTEVTLTGSFTCTIYSTFMNIDDFI
jgi:hypothetical protein